MGFSCCQQEEGRAEEYVHIVLFDQVSVSLLGMSNVARNRQALEEINELVNLPGVIKNGNENICAPNHLAA